MFESICSVLGIIIRIVILYFSLLVALDTGLDKEHFPWRCAGGTLAILIGASFA